MNVLVTGGAGYIGSHVVRELIKRSYEVIVYDSLELGHEKAVDEKAKLIVANISDEERLNSVFENNNIDAVMHFAGYTDVGESVKNPDKYLKNNFENTKILLNVMIKNNCKNFIFSSSCAIFGNPISIPITEDLPKNPISPYGESKLLVETLLKEYELKHELKFISLRYFNAAGASEDGSIGEDHNPETHLIPLVLQVALGQRENIKIFGTDYETKDGTCVRDYIHVLDLAEAHILALDNIENKSGFYMLGSGTGFSVKEIIETCKEITGKEIKTIETERRQGDPPLLVAGNEKARTELRWELKHSDLKNIIKTAWLWHSTNPKGFIK